MPSSCYCLSWRGLHRRANAGFVWVSDPGDYVTFNSNHTPDGTDADPRHVYHDVLIALDEARGINNGQPSLWDELGIRTGEQVLHLGCGTGYYTAIAAELVG